MPEDFSPIAGLSHEIRTPLVGILGMAQLLAATELNDEQRRLLEGIFEGGEALLATLDGMIELSRLDAGMVEWKVEAWDLRPWLASACELLRPQAEAKGLSIEAHCDEGLPARLRGDATRIRQILLNLLSNAIRHTEQGAIEVRLTWEAPSAAGPAFLGLSVRDRGEGIDDELLARLFSPRPGRPADFRGRAGLGLAICYRLARGMGGDMWVLSHGGEGCTFYLRLPSEAVVGTGEEAVPASGRPTRFDSAFAAAHPLDILVVDDDPVNRQVITMFLERLGYKALSAGSGAEALARLASSPVDLVLLDVEMPGLDGPAVAQRIRTTFAPQRRPFVAAVTAHVLDRSADRLQKLGMDDFLGKPFRVEALRALIERAEAWRRSQAAGT